MKKINTTHKYMYGLLTNQKKKYIYMCILIAFCLYMAACVLLTPSNALLR